MDTDTDQDTTHTGTTDVDPRQPRAHSPPRQPERAARSQMGWWEQAPDGRWHRHGGDVPPEERRQDATLVRLRHGGELLVCNRDEVASSAWLQESRE